MIAAVNGTHLYVHTVGTGRPLVFLHSGLGLDHSCFSPLLDPLASAGVQLIYYDHRGNGRSDRTGDPATLTHQVWVDDIDALRAHLGHERIILFGHSCGGFLALEYALRYPQHVDGLILCAASGAMTPLDVVQANVIARATPEQLHAFAMLASGTPVPGDDVLEDIWRTVLPLYFKHPDPRVIARMIEATEFCAAAWNACVSWELTFDVMRRAGQISCPALLLSGADDWIIPPAQVAALQSEMPRAEMVVLPNSGHWPFIEETPGVMDAVRTWLHRAFPAG